MPGPQRTENQRIKMKMQQCSGYQDIINNKSKYCKKRRPVEYFQKCLTEGVCSMMYVQEEYVLMQSVDVLSK